MSNLAKKKWEKWHPKEIFLNNSKKQYSFFWNKSILKETDFYLEKQDKSSNIIKQESKKKSFENEVYFSNLMKNLKEKEKKYTLLNNKLKDLCTNFESTIYVFEKTLFSRLLKTTLIISSYIVGKNILFDESILLKKINTIIKDDNFFLKKPQLVVHPNNKKILEKILKKSLKQNKWELIYNKKVDINGFQIQSENGNIDNTIYARWKEVYRAILEVEEHE